MFLRKTTKQLFFFLLPSRYVQYLLNIKDIEVVFLPFFASSFDRYESQATYTSSLYINQLNILPSVNLNPTVQCECPAKLNFRTNMYLRSHYPASGRFKSIYMIPRGGGPQPMDDDNEPISDDSMSDVSFATIPSLPPSPATDSEDNSDSMAFHRGGHISSAAGGSSSASPGGKSGRPCQYNFLVNLGKFDWLLESWQGQHTKYECFIFPQILLSIAPSG